MAQFLHPSLSDISLDMVMHALAEPTRLRIVQRLSETEEADGLTCSQGVCDSVPRATMSNHYSVLRNAGLIESRKRGTAVLNRLRRDDVDARFPGLLETVLDLAPALEK